MNNPTSVEKPIENEEVDFLDSRDIKTVTEEE
jgi:hypothetical protein